MGLTVATESAEGTERINRYLARAGIGSRRKADELITAGRVAINGVTVEKLATFVDTAHDRVSVDGKELHPPVETAIWIALNKRPDTLTTRSDMRGRATIYDGLPPVYAQLISVGRLDLDTTGLLLLTNDGETASRLMHPSYEIERVYEAMVAGVPTKSTLRKMAQGVDLGDPTPARAHVDIIARYERGAILKLVLKEGRKREVKRLCQALGHRVHKLKRVSYAGITVKGMEEGQWRKLRDDEIAKLRRAVGLEGADPTSRR